MDGRAVRGSPARWVLAALLVVPAGTAAAPEGPGPAAVAPVPAGAAAEEVYANIQVLRGTPAAQVLPAMELIAAALGVGCEHCHLPGSYEADDRPAKRTAREMVLMMRAINRDHFEGRLAVTCWSCHRGGIRPAAEPPPAAAAAGPPGPPAAESAALEAAPGVTAEEVLARHLEAVGGADAARAVAARVARGTATLFGGREFPVEIRQRAPRRSTTVLSLPGGDLVTTLDGAAGTVASPGRPPRPMHGAEIAVAALANDFDWVARPAAALSDLRVAGRRILDGREAIVVEARVEGHPVELSFDRGDGLLRRVLAWAETPFGRLPTRVDFAEYRAVDGLRTPAVWTVARPQGSFTVRLTAIEHEG